LGKQFASVLIDTYNHERFIEEAIVRVLEQDFPTSDREIIVVDDGSTDRTPEIVKKFEPQVRLLCKENGGQASAFNAGIPECKGEIIAFLDGDDWWERNKLGVVAAEFESHPEIGTIGHGIYEVDEQGRRCYQITPERRYESHLHNVAEGREFLHLRAFLGTSRLAIRKAIASKALPLPIALRIEADEFLSTVTTAIGGTHVLTDPLTNYRLHSANLFHFAERDPARERVRHDVVAGIERELPSRLLAAGVSPQVAQILIISTHIDAERGRLALSGGWSWETVAVEREAFRESYRNASRGYRVFQLAVLCVAGLLPPRLFYRLRRLYAEHNLARFRATIGDATPTSSGITRKVAAL
jgi:glycosyltransferase involved in cell wall biosynthesis